MSHTSAKTSVLWAALAVLALAAAMAVFAALFRDHLTNDDEILSTSITTAIYALLALLVALVVARRPRTGWTAAALLLASYISWLVFIWADPSWQNRRPYEAVSGSLTTIAGVALHLGVLWLATLRAPLWKILRNFVAICSVVIGLALLLEVGLDGALLPHDADAFLGVLFLLTVLGTVMVPIASAIERSTASDTQESDLDLKAPVTLTCPRCNAQAQIHSNTNAACPACALRIRVTIEEPRCACGYLLYNLHTDHCPECGDPIPESKRWNPTAPIPE